MRELQDQCVSCHAQEAEEHALSKHASAESSPVFVALRDRQAKRGFARAGPADHADTEFCDACHRPIECVDCHAAVGNEAVKNGLMIWDLDGPVRGPTGRRSSAPHATRRSEYLTSADICGTCHQVEGPAGFSEAPFLHWQSSPAAARNQTCSDCHQTHRRTVTHGEGVRLELGAEEITIDHTEGGHHFPDGASFLRDVDVVVRSAGLELHRIPLAAQLFDDTSPVVLPTDAKHVYLRGVEAGTSWSEPIPAGADSACIELRRFRSDLVAALGLAIPEEVESFGCVSR